MHIVTGGAGFIGSAMVWKLNRMGIDDVWIIDTLEQGEKWKNLVGLRYSEILTPDGFLHSLHHNDDLLPTECESIINMGACSSTTERNADWLVENNFQFSKTIAEIALKECVRFVHASSAATYGGGELDYGDGEENLFDLRPLNMYGYSKLMFDQWAHHEGALKNMASLRFFNVYGPNEYHKGDMASMVFKAFHQVKETGKLNLFKSHRPDYADGGQMRDFVYIKDVIDAIWWLVRTPEANGIFNIGTGEETTWNDLAGALFAAMDTPANIQYIDMPESIRGQYQYRTRADIARLRKAGYTGAFRPVADGVRDYVVNHLAQANPFINNGK